MDDCGPYTCKFPSPALHNRGTEWECPECRTVYRLTGPKNPRWYRNWYATNGHWVMRRPMFERALRAVIVFMLFLVALACLAPLFDKH